MSQNAEHIEAKLCAYIDGDLDANEIADIEKHLAANPNHRAVIEELKRQRVMVRELPRAKAPADIAESIQGHLERAVLLDDQADEQVSDMRINRWPQIMAAAAVLLLASGLGVVIYNMLPRSGQQVVIAPTGGPSNPIVTAPSTQSSETQAVVAHSDAAQPSDTLAKGEHDALKKSETSGGTTPTLASKDDKDFPDGILAEQVGKGALMLKREEMKTLRSAMADRSLESARNIGPIVMVGVTRDVDAVSNRLVSYFNTNNIRWDTNPVGDESVAARRKDAKELDGAGAPAAIPAGPNPVADSTLSDAAAEDAKARERSAIATAQLPRRAGDTAPAAPAGQGASRGSGATPATHPAELQVAPGVTLSPSPTTSPDGSHDLVLANSAKMKGAATQPELAEGSESGSHRTVIVARALNGAQVEELTKSLNAEHDAQWSMEVRKSARAEVMSRQLGMKPGGGGGAGIMPGKPSTMPGATTLRSLASGQQFGGGAIGSVNTDGKVVEKSDKLASDPGQAKIAGAQNAATAFGAATRPSATLPSAATTRPSDVTVGLRKANGVAEESAAELYDFVIVLQNTPLAAAGPATAPALNIPHTDATTKPVNADEPASQK